MNSSMGSLIFLLTVSLSLLNSHAIPKDDSSGYHGFERDALFVLRAGFGDSVLNRNWTGLMCYLNAPPRWQGIQCVNGRVTGILLENMGLTGEIKSDVLANFTELSVLSFKDNSLSGNLMDFTNNQKLERIDLSGNNFLGEIPSSLLSLNSLESLQLQGNKLIGNIPAFDQPTLTIFDVSYNDLSGEIPETLQSYGALAFIGNLNLCGPPTSKACSVQNVSKAIGGDNSSHNNSNDSNSSNKGHSYWKLAVILIAVDVIVLVFIICLFIIYYKKYKKLKKEKELKNVLPREVSHETPRSMEQVIPEGEKGKLVFMESNSETRFELDELLTASAEGLGKGNCGDCFKATLESGPVVAVKRLRDLKPMSKEEFLRHVTSIVDQKHPNLLPLLAYYYSKDEKLFLYPFAPNGNVYNCLHGGRGTRDRVPFRWSARLAVARGVVRAIEHLHQNTKSQTTTPHGNLKSSNVLLNENDETLVTDYGLTSLIALPIASQRMVSYKTPEYQSHKRISKKSDVWSYGCLLLELLTGRIPAHSAPQGTTGVDLCSWVHRAVREEWTAEIFDTEIAMQRGANQGMLRMMHIALQCCDKSPEKRPEIGEVAAEVEEIQAVWSSEEDDENSGGWSVDRSLTDDSFATPSIVIM